MTTQELLEGFERNKAYFTDTIFDMMLFSDEISENDCKIIESGLKTTAEKGNKTAAAIYAVITVYNNEYNVFSSDAALNLLLATDAFEEYKHNIHEVFDDILEDEELGKYLELPTIWFSEAISKAE